MALQVPELFRGRSSEIDVRLRLEEVMKRRSVFLCLSVALFSTLGLASVPAGQVIFGSNLFTESHASEAASLALFGAGLLCAARWLQPENRKG
jgi:peptidoglycan biosynthesis protein MviN/MurJ (putative lipid II flippase)